jgi:molybdopterin/thiamine biosynthesis adenylyltransferase
VVHSAPSQSTRQPVRGARERLASRRVLIIGVGGLGTPAALRLAAAGLGTLGLIDSDTVDVSNLHRQILYRTADLGRPKVVAAAERLAASYPAVAVRCFAQRLSVDNAAHLVGDFDFVIDATDGVASKYLVNDAAVLSRVPFSHAGVLALHGQTMTVLPGRSACLRCLFPTPSKPDELPTCQQAGIIGSVAGTIGVLQATEALKYLLGVGQLLTDRLLTYDAAAARWRMVVLERRRDCPLCGDRPTIHTPVAVEDGTCE